jgi:hypothetical protein
MRKAAHRTILLAATLAVMVVGEAHGRVFSQSRAAQTPKPFVFEFYYKVKWGALDEFLALYKKNHYPVLQRLQKDGSILQMSAAFPVNHAGEEKRWDFRFTIVYRDVVAAHAETSEALIKELYPDQATFEKEEKRRFELLLEHMDVAVNVDDLKDWR